MMTKEEKNAYWRQWRLKNREHLKKYRRKREGRTRENVSWNGKWDELRMMYENKQKYHIADIAQHFGCSKRAVRDAAKRINIRRG